MDLKGYDVEEEHKIITEIITTLSNLYEDLEFSVVREPIVYYEKWQFQDYILNGSKVNEKTSTHSIYCTNKEMFVEESLKNKILSFEIIKKHFATCQNKINVLK